jgi:hypothetical protein
MSWLASPLIATFVVCAGLSAIAVPLRELTSRDRPVSASESSSTHPENNRIHEIRCVLRIKLLVPAKSLRVSTTNGDLLWQMANLPAGESDSEVNLLLVDAALELLVEADFGDAAGETALFLTVLPDGVEEQTRYAIGAGKVDEIFSYEWELD